MTAERKSAGAAWRGVEIAAVLSAAFVGLLFLTSPLVAALVIVPVSVAVGAARARAVPRGAPHCLVEPRFSATATIAASRAVETATRQSAPSTGSPSAA